MRAKRIAGILIILVLLAVLTLIVSSRAGQNKKVVIDGGQATPEITAAPQAVETAEPTAEPVPTPAPTHPDIDIDSWEYLLVNSENPIQNVPRVSQVGDTGAYFDTRAVDALKSMVSACKDAGYSVYINLAYVPSDAQKYYYDNEVRSLENSGKTEDEAASAAKKLVEQPGQSDHQTGLGVDLTDKYYPPYSTETLSSGALQWLEEHCADYGFIQHYPAGKGGITGYVQAYHFRYVGKEAAQYINQHGLCLEEFTALYK